MTLPPLIEQGSGTDLWADSGCRGDTEAVVVLLLTLTEKAGAETTTDTETKNGL